MNEMIGNVAGAIWMALNENGCMNAKDLKKAAKIKTDKELYLDVKPIKQGSWPLRLLKGTCNKISLHLTKI